MTDAIANGRPQAPNTSSTHTTLRDRLRRVVEEVGSDIFGAAGGVVTGQVRSARETVDEVRAAWDEQPTIERRIAVGAYELFENGIEARLRRLADLTRLGAAVVGGGARIAYETSPAVIAAREGSRIARNAVAAGADGAVAAAGSYADTGRRIVERSVEARAESTRQVGEAIAAVGGSWRDNASRTAAQVREAWDEQPTIERRVAVGGWRLLEGSIRNSIDHQRATANVVREVGEAAARDAVTGVQNYADAIAAPFKAAGSFLGGVFGG